MAEKKYALIIIAFTLMAFLGGCSSDGDDQIIPGYWSPGEFRPKGVAPEKAYNFGNPTIARSCASVGNDGRCRVIYGSWPTGASYTESVILSGFALDDSHRLSNTVKTLSFVVKVINIGGIWNVYMIINGVEYRGTVPGSEVTITDPPCDTDKNPACSPSTTPPCTETFEASGGKLTLRRIDFNSTVTLTPTITVTPTTTPPVYIQGGDYIVAQVYGI